MDWTAAIETNREALKRIVAALADMAGLDASAFTSPLRGGQREASGGGWGAPVTPTRRSDDRRPPLEGKVKPALTLPRHLHRVILRLLRPAESAARRLVIALARGLAHPPATLKAGPAKSTQPRARKAKPAPLLVRHGVGTGIVLRPGAPVPPHLAHLVPAKAAQRPFSFPLLDPLPRWRERRRWQPAAGTPRISMGGVAERPAVPAWRPPLPDDPLDACRLGRRLAALARALDDLPGQARRFQRWQARRDRALSAGRVHRVTALRGGRSPGGRLARYDPDARRRSNIREIDEILSHAHALARHALSPDTS